MGCTGSKEEEKEARAPKKSIALTPTEVLARVQMPACPAFSVVAKAVKNGDKKFVKIFVDGWSVHAREYGSDLVDIAANQRQYNIWKMLLDAKLVDVNWKRPTGYTILMEAVFAHDTEMLRFLLECGANVNDKHLNNWTVVMMAVKEHSYKMLKTLLEYEFEGINEQTDPDGYSALLLAVNQQDIKDELKYRIVETLLDEGADPNLRTVEGVAPLHVAVMTGNIKICELLINAGADVSQGGKQNKNCLHYAAMCGNINIAKAIYAALKKMNKSTLGFYLNAQTQGEGWTPLMYCANLGHTEIGLFLVEEGADCNIKSYESGKSESISPYAMAKNSSATLLLHVIPPTVEDIALQEIERKAIEQNKAMSPSKTKSSQLVPHKKISEAEVKEKSSPINGIDQTTNPVHESAAEETKEFISKSEASPETNEERQQFPPPVSQLEVVGPPPMEGFLRRADGNQNWGVLRGGVLSFYESSASDVLVDKRDIHDSTKLYVADTMLEGLSIECSPEEFVLQDGEVTEKFGAQSVEDKAEWVTSLEEFIYSETL